MGIFKRKKADTGSADARLEELQSEAAASQAAHAEARRHAEASAAAVRALQLDATRLVALLDFLLERRA